MSYLTEALKELNSKGEWSSKKVKKTNKKLNESVNLNEKKELNIAGDVDRYSFETNTEPLSARNFRKILEITNPDNARAIVDLYNSGEKLTARSLERVLSEPLSARNLEKILEITGGASYQKPELSPSLLKGASFKESKKINEADEEDEMTPEELVDEYAESLFACAEGDDYYKYMFWCTDTPEEMKLLVNKIIKENHKGENIPDEAIDKAVEKLLKEHEYLMDDNKWSEKLFKETIEAAFKWASDDEIRDFLYDALKVKYGDLHQLAREVMEKFGHIEYK